MYIRIFYDTFHATYEICCDSATFTYSKSTTETLQKAVKYVQN